MIWKRQSRFEDERVALQCLRWRWRRRQRCSCICCCQSHPLCIRVIGIKRVGRVAQTHDASACHIRHPARNMIRERVNVCFRAKMQEEGDDISVPVQTRQHERSDVSARGQQFKNQQVYGSIFDLMILRRRRNQPLVRCIDISSAR